MTANMRDWPAQSARPMPVRAYDSARWHLGFAADRVGAGWHGLTVAARFRRHLLAGLPALAASLGILGLAVAVSQEDPYDRRGHYEEEGRSALERTDYETAEICFRRLSGEEDGAVWPEHLYQLAVADAGLGEMARAAAIVDRLAPDDRGGYAPAHLLRARKFLARADGGPAAVKAAEVQLRWAVGQRPDLLEAQMVLGQLYCDLGRPDIAEPYLLLAAGARPGLRLLLADAYAARGNRAGTRAQAEQVLLHYLPEVDEAATRMVAILACGRAYLLIDDYARAVEILRRGLGTGDDSAVGSSLAGAYAAWASAPGPNGAAPAADLRLRRVEEGLRAAPSDSRLLPPLVELMNRTGAEADRARILLERMAAEGPPSATLHLLLGMDDWKRGRTEAARFHLNLANRLAPDSGPIANNLAWMLAEAVPPDLSRAGELADTAVAQAPDNPHFRDTRGRISLRRERWQDALVDLELAQRGMPQDGKIHEALAVACDHLGLFEPAARHRAQVREKSDR